jgi:hypothetical protein
MQYALIFYNLQLILAPMGLHPLGSPGPPPASHAFLRQGGGLDARQAAGRLTPCLRAGRALVTGSGPPHALLMGESGEPRLFLFHGYSRSNTWRIWKGPTDG